MPQKHFDVTLIMLGYVCYGVIFFCFQDVPTVIANGSVLWNKCLML